MSYRNNYEFDCDMLTDERSNGAPTVPQNRRTDEQESHFILASESASLNGTDTQRGSPTGFFTPIRSASPTISMLPNMKKARLS